LAEFETSMVSLFNVRARFGLGFRENGDIFNACFGGFGDYISEIYLTIYLTHVSVVLFAVVLFAVGGFVCCHENMFCKKGRRILS